MKSPFDDTLPEEEEPEYKELTTLLQQAYSTPVSVTPDRQAQILARVRQRLGITDRGASLNGKRPVPVSTLIEKSSHEDQEDSRNGKQVVPQPGALDSSPHEAESPTGKPHREKRPLRFMALLAAALVVVVLLGTPLLLLRSRLLSTGGDNHATKTPAGVPTLTLSPDIATIGSTVQLALKNFPPNTRVALTHDVREPIFLKGGSSIITVGPSGSATVDAYVGSDWAVGFDQIYAEDLASRYTVSAQLQVIGKGPTQTYDSFVATNGIMYGFDAQHTHFNPFEHWLTPTTVGGLTKKWAYDLGASVISSPTVAGGVVYIGCVCGYLYALDAATGSKEWAYSTGGSQIADVPAVVGGVVYFGTIESHTLYALDAVTGAKRWAYRTSGAVISSPTVVDGVVYVGSDDNTLYAIDAHTGAQRWTYWTRGSIEGSPAVAGGIVYVGSFDGNVYALDATTGAKKWAYRTGNDVYNSPAVSGGVVYVGAGDGNVYALDALTGAKKWAYRIGDFLGPTISSPAVANGMVYVRSLFNHLYALDARTGARKWISPAQVTITTEPMVAGGLIYFGGEGKYYALDAATGALKWAYGDGIGTFVCSPVVANGVVYFGTLSLYAFHLPGT
jgi:outer membrane protein assembly factor BamB